jgi:haloalkane dehalogenase
VGGRRVAFVDYGSGSPVVFIHGIPSWSYTFRRQIIALAGRYRVVAPDLLGFGASDGAPRGASFVEQADMVEDLLAMLDLGRIRLVLHDWGGPIGLRWAARHPERVGRLVLINTMASPAFRPPMYWRPLVAPLLGELLVVRWNAFVELLPLALRAAHDPGMLGTYRAAFAAASAALGHSPPREAAWPPGGHARGGIAARGASHALLDPMGRAGSILRAAHPEGPATAAPERPVPHHPQRGHFPFEDQPTTVDWTLKHFLGGDLVDESRCGEFNDGS